MRLTNLQHQKLGSLARQSTSVLGLLMLCAAGSASDNVIYARVDGDLVNFPDVQPVMVQNHVMVPVRGIFEKMNASVLWDASSSTVIARRGADRIYLPVNSYRATVNGRAVEMDTPAIMRHGRTMVPLRFLTETLGGSVQWIEDTCTVEITSARMGNTSSYNNLTDSQLLTQEQRDQNERARQDRQDQQDRQDRQNRQNQQNRQNNANRFNYTRVEAGTVIPFRINQAVSSNRSPVGTKFTADLDTSSSGSYQGIPDRAMLRGHVAIARPRNGNTPGVLGLAFDRIRMPDGQEYAIYGNLIGLDSNSVDNNNGRLIAKPGAKNDNLKFVGYGAGAGALVGIITKGNMISNTLIGSALGFLYGETQKNQSKPRDVLLNSGTRFGVRLTRDLNIRNSN